MKKIGLLFLLFCLITIPCFAQTGIVGESLITLASGEEKPVKDIQKGDLVLALDIKSTSIVVSKVVEAHQITIKDVQEILLANGSQLELGASQIILINKGYASFNSKLTKESERYKKEKVRNYKVDSFVYAINSDSKIGILPIIEIKTKKEETIVYSLQLDNENGAYIANGFFVGQ